MAKARTLDMANVSEGRMFNKKRKPEGDYAAEIVKVDDAKKKDDPSKKMWLFSIKVGSAIYPFYCGFGDKERWKIKNLWVACGVAVPSKKASLDPNKLVNKKIGVTLEDDEYDGKEQSSIAATFPISELEEMDEGEEPKKSKKKDKGKAKKDADVVDIKSAKSNGKGGKHGKHGKKGKSKVKDNELEALDVEEV